MRVGRERDQGFRPHLELVPAGLAVRRHVGVVGGFHFEVVGRVHHLDAAQVLHIADAFPAGNDHPQGIALLGTHRLAILAVGHDHVVHALLKRNALGMPVGVRAFGHQPAGILLHSGFLEQQREQHPRPFAGTDSSMYLLNNKRALRQRRGIGHLNSLHHGLVVRHPAVPRALDKMNPRDRRQPLQLLHREHQGPVHHPVDHQPVLARINVRKARPSPSHEMERGRRDNSRRIL